MENHHDDGSTDNDKRMMNSFERYSDDKEERKKKEKKKRQRQAKQEKRQSEEEQAEQDKKDEGKRPSLLDALIQAEAPDAKKDKAEKRPAEEEADATVEKRPEGELSAEEQRAATEEYIVRRQEQLAAEEIGHAEENPETQANRNFLQRLADRLRHTEEAPDDELLQAVAEETVAELHEEVDGEAEETAGTDDEALRNETVEQLDDRAASGQEDRESSYTPTRPPVVPPPITPDLIDAATSPSADGGLPPASSGWTGRSEPSPLFSANREGASTSHEASGPVEHNDNKARSGGEFLLGAFVGYLFGRRRGRIKAESEYSSERQKLENEVRQLQTKIESYEDQVRSAAVRRQEVRPPAYEQSDVGPATGEARSSETFIPSIPKVERNARESTIQAIEASSPEQSEPAGSISPERVRTMPLAEVLREAEQVDYRGTSLKRLYEQGFLNESGLRETMRTYLAGERYEQQLERQIRASAELSPRPHEHERTSVSQPDRKPGVASRTSTSNVSSDEPPGLLTPHAIDEEPGQDMPPQPETRKLLASPAIRQASIGAAIGVVFVVAVIIFFSFR